MTGVAGEVDGVPTFSLPEGLVPGPLHAVLVLGVGRSDETLANAGITHLAEHLLLSGMGRKPYSWNGEVGLISTMFMCAGDPDDVVDFFDYLAKHFSHPFPERFDDELRVLRVEAERRQTGRVETDLSLRLGARGAGLAGWPELGFHRLRWDDIVEWGQARFTGNNAALLVSGPVPASLDLSWLPWARVTRPAPQLCPAPPRAWAKGQASLASVSFISQMGWATPVGMEFARQRAFDALRRRDGISYSLQYNHNRLLGGLAHESLVADGSTGSFEHVVSGLDEALAAVAREGATEEELDIHRKLMRQARAHPGWLMAHLRSSAERLLLGLPVPSAEEAMERLDRVTAEDIAKEMTSIQRSALLITPPEVVEPPHGWTLWEDWTKDRIEGIRYEAIPNREKGTLTIGVDGVSWSPDPALARTIPWRDAAAVLRWDNGIRRVVGNSGTSVSIAPWNWRQGDGLTSLVDRYTRPDLSIPMGPGSAEYRLKPEDPGSVAHVAWLATIPDVLWNGSRASLVIDAWALLLLRPVLGQSVPQRMMDLRALNRGALLAANPVNRFVAGSSIRRAGVRFRRVPISTRGVALLTIEVDGSPDIEVVLLTMQHVNTARVELSRMLGDRFVDQ